MAGKVKLWRDPWLWVPAALLGVPVFLVIGGIGVGFASIRCCGASSGAHPVVYVIAVAFALLSALAAAAAGAFAGWLIKRLIRGT